MQESTNVEKLEQRIFVMVCKKCGKELTQEMIDVNLCWSCGDIINENLVEQNGNTDEPVMDDDANSYSDLSECNNDGIGNKNFIGMCLRILGISILIFGTIGSFIFANVGDRYSSFSFMLFFIYEFATILSGFIFIGFAEIIHLLNKISNK